MFLDYLYAVPNASTGIDEALLDTVITIPIFTPMLLLFVFFTVALAGANLQKRRVGSMDLPMWSTVASLSTMMVGLLLSLGDGLIDITTLSLVAVVTIFCGFWLFLDRNKNEV